jgi:ATP-dependent exoDNAse (exonuclease V) beta subunit
VDRVYRAREAQETRRILYVAATRAREELHLFARPDYKTEHDGSYTLCEPRESLLSTAWPALGNEIKRRFDRWAKKPEDFEIAAIAASGADPASDAANVLVMPRPAKPAFLRRLPPDYQLPAANAAPLQANAAVAGIGGAQLYQRHEGGVLSRALGSAVHFLFEELARLRTAQEWPSARAALHEYHPRIIAHLRSAGVEQQEAAKIAGQALEIAIKASHDADGQWILSPHRDAANEVRWAGVIAGSLHEVRVDRVFRAGATPDAEGDQCWWIIDYKTAHEAGIRADSLPRLRALFAPQLELYAKVLRNLHGKDAAIRAGLYYPRMLAFDWWEL